MSDLPGLPPLTPGYRAAPEGGLESAVRRGRRRRTVAAGVATAAAAAAALALTTVVSFGASSSPDSLQIAEPSVSPTPPPTAIATTAAAQASQTPQEARRDGVVPEVAALSFEARVGIVERQDTPEGTWVVSRMPAAAGGASSGSLGSGSVYGKSVVSAYEYGEVLLLDRAASRILRAFPLPGLPPQRLLLTPAAIYCERQGDGALPDSMLCRIDRRTLEWMVRVFPWTTDSGFHPVRPELYVPSNWTINEPFGRAIFQTLGTDGRSLFVTGTGERGRVDAVTLAIEAVTSDG